VACRGAPRDLGLDQGSACADAVRGRVDGAGRRRWPGRFAPHDADAAGRAADRAVGRDLRRHFPHLAERLAGLARGARVPESALVHLLARGAGLAELAVAAEPGAGGAARGLAVRVPPGGIVRRSRPDVGFAALEWTLPWLPGALAGVNAAGLAVAAVPGVGGSDPSGVAAPAWLLVQGCLGQFESAASALEWCERRPAGGRAELRFADGAGHAAIVVEAGKRFRTDGAVPVAGAAAGALLLRTGPEAPGLELPDGRRLAFGDERPASPDR
jgi:hypothetical protein